MISKEHLLSLLKKSGYVIEISQRDNSKFVQFNHRHAVEPCKILHSYSTEWNDREIELDLVFRLLNWSGMKVTYTLEY